MGTGWKTKVLGDGRGEQWIGERFSAAMCLVGNNRWWAERAGSLRKRDQRTICPHTGAGLDLDERECGSSSARAWKERCFWPVAIEATVTPSLNEKEPSICSFLFVPSLPFFKHMLSHFHLAVPCTVEWVGMSKFALLALGFLRISHSDGVGRPSLHFYNYFSSLFTFEWLRPSNLKLPMY